MKVNNNRDDRIKELGLTSKKKSELKSLKKKESSYANSKKESSTFEGIFLDHTSKIDDKEVNNIVKNIDILGNKLKKSAKVEDFYEYKKLLKSLYRQLIPNAYDVRKSHSKPSFSKPVTKEFHVVKTIDQSLESLLKLIKETQKNNIKIASKVIEIKGLVVNLLN